MSGQDVMRRIDQAVLAGGGKKVGVQYPLVPDTAALIMFTSPTTGNTLAVPISVCDLETENFSDTDLTTAVCRRIAESDATFAARSVSVKASKLKEISDTLLNLSHEIDDIYFRREKCPTSKKS